jgi:hypothetical protein
MLVHSDAAVIADRTEAADGARANERTVVQIRVVTDRHASGDLDASLDTSSFAEANVSGNEWAPDRGARIPQPQCYQADVFVQERRKELSELHAETESQSIQRRNCAAVHSTFPRPR